jgi:hypothetical protein
MDQTDDRVTCDRCGATATRLQSMIPAGWQWIVLDFGGFKSRLLCEACKKSVLAFIDRKEIQP